jgi:sugar phosphate isomerase/epimerase
MNVMWRTALHSVSYAGLWGQASLTLEGFLDRARALGFDAVMLMAKRPHLSALDCDPDTCKRLREHLENLDLKVACLAGYNDFGIGSERPDVPLSEMQLLYFRELCRCAQTLGCKLVRVFTGFPAGKVSHDQLWKTCVQCLRECSRLAADFGVTIGVQNHHDLAGHYESFVDLLEEIGEPNCRAIFDAWAPALQGGDLATAVQMLGPYIVHTTVADYVRRPRFHYNPTLVNYVREDDVIRAVPPGEGFIDYRSFFRTLRSVGYQGHVAFEMCSPMKGGGSEANLDRCARQFLAFMAGM